MVRDSKSVRGVVETSPGHRPLLNTRQEIRLLLSEAIVVTLFDDEA
jgi:hypothetical protein